MENSPLYIKKYKDHKSYLEKLNSIGYRVGG